MHNYFFPLQDSYITNTAGYENSNFGLTEILKVGAIGGYVSTISQTSSESYNNSAANITLTGFIGTISGSFNGYVDFFSGSVNGINSTLDVSYFSGSINSSSSIFSGSILSSSIVGTISGSVYTYDCNSYFSGSAVKFSGSVNGIITGEGLVNYPSTVITNNLTACRTVIKFDLNDISQSVASNSTPSSSFYLNLKVCDEVELPINYTIYAFAISQSWTMGPG